MNASLPFPRSVFGHWLVVALGSSLAACAGADGDSADGAASMTTPTEMPTPGAMSTSGVPTPNTTSAAQGNTPDPQDPAPPASDATDSPTSPTPGTPASMDPESPVDTPETPVDPAPDTPVDPAPDTPVDAPTNPPVEIGTAAGVSSVLLVPGANPTSGDGFGSDLFAVTPLAVDATGERVFVGYNDASAPATGIIAGSDGTTIQIEDAVIGGVAVTSDGVAALLFDPNPSSDDRVWAAVARYDEGGAELFRTELFHSPNLEDEGTKGAPTTSRFAYLSESDTLVAYFAHTQRYDDGVRHQGGYFALVDGSGEQNLLNGWFGSHNLDQRMVSDGSEAYVIGLGDAYPEGIFFSSTASGNRTNPVVLQPLASAGNGATNGQLGGIVDLGTELVIPFITNLSVPADIDAGTWPDIDETVADQIRDAASNGTDLGVMRVSKGSLPEDDGALEVTWLDVALTDGASLSRLKSAPFGSGLMALLWAERTGSNRGGSNEFFTMVLGTDLSVVTPKASLDAAYAFSGGDDVVPSSTGSVLWASARDDGIHLVTMNPE